MIGRLRDWINHRIGLQDIVQHALYEPIPGGARFRYVTGSVLVFCFATQAITGIFLWMAYSPSSQTAYESTYYIQHEMAGGWFVRGLHHFTAQAMVVVMALHMLQVVWDGAYRAPREVNYWLGLVLLQLVLGLGLTGYLLPWDQKGYWATNVATNLATLVPVVGKDIQQLAVGGNEYGHHTLTRFFALHAGVLPALLVIFLVLHIAIFRRHGIMAKITPGRADETFWPRQVLFDALGCLVLLLVVLGLTVHFDPAVFTGNLPPEHKGAELGAPADPSEAYSAARPEWYYLFLFQLLKYFPGPLEIIGALVIPGVVMTILFLLPFIGRTNFGHQFARAFMVLLLVGAAGLTGMALADDYYALIAPRFGWKNDKKLTASREFLQARLDAEHDAHRTDELINRWVLKEDGKPGEPQMIPRQGAVYLLRNDPLTRGPRLFKQHCASCHSYYNPADPDGQQDHQFLLMQSPQTKPGPVVDKVETLVVVRDAKGEVSYDPVPEAGGAPNLYGFASRGWIRGLLDKERIAAPVVIGEPKPSSNPVIAANPEDPQNYNRPLLSDYFGNTNHKAGRMATWVAQHAELLNKENAEAIAASLSAQARLPYQAEDDKNHALLIQKGIGLIEQHCVSCHKFGDKGELGLAPDLTGYGSYEWMMGLVSDPAHERFYRTENDRMPSFAKDLAHPEKNNVSTRELSLIVDWLRKQYFDPKAKSPILPHTEANAADAVQLARVTSNPHTQLVGAKPAPAESQQERAEQLFAQNCAACHSYTDDSGRGIAARQPSAPNLFGFGSRQWLTGLLDPAQAGGEKYFGNTRHFEGDMVTFVNDNFKEPNDETKAKIQSIIAAVSAEAALPAQAEDDKKAKEDGTLDKGRAALAESFDTASCLDCHKFRDAGEPELAPTLTGWGSQDWLVRFISDPAHQDFYRDTNDRMPAFAKKGPGPTIQPLLSADDITLLARWLRGEKLE
jgi:ubiquinol-cytochrome c reductase cytochrome b subunit